MPKVDEEILSRIKQDRETFFKDIQKQFEVARSLPQETRGETIQNITNLMKQGSQSFGQQLQQVQAGTVPETYKNAKTPSEGALDYILRSFGKPLNAVNYAVQSVTATNLEDREKAKELAFKSATPFYETATGERVEDTSGAETLEKMGVAEGGHFSDVLPGLYSDTGEEWTKFRRDGIMDPTARGAAGLAADLVADPTNLIPVGKVLGLSARGLDNFAKPVTSKLRTMAYDNEAIQTIARGFNRMTFLARDPEKAGQAEEVLRQLLTDKDVLGEKGLKGLANVFTDPAMLKDQKTVQALVDLDDFTRLVEEKDFTEIAKKFPNMQQSLMIDKSGNFSAEKFLDIHAANTGLTPMQLVTAKNARKFLDEKGVQSVEAGLLKQEDLVRNYLPRQLVNMKVLDDIGIAELQAMAPEQRALYEKIITDRDSAIHAGLSADSVNLNRLQGSTPFKHRIYKSHAEAANHAKTFGGEMNRNLGELLFQAQNRLDTTVAHKKALESLSTIFGADSKYWPKNVKSTLEDILKKDADNPVNKIKGWWNKYFLTPFKQSITFPFPAYHMRNIIDDTLRGYQKFGLSFANPVNTGDAMHVISDSAKEVDLGNGIVMPASKLLEDAINLGAYKHQFHRADVTRTLTQAIKKYQEAPGTMKSTLKTAMEWLPVSETFALKFNNHARVKGFLTSLKNTIAERGIKDINSKEFQAALLTAAKDSKHAFIDLADLGPIDDLLAQVIPFYRFSRKNIPFQLQMLAQNPDRISKIGILQNHMQTDSLTPQEEEMLAPTLKDNLNISMGDTVNGNKMIMSSIGIGLEELNKLYRSDGWVKTISGLTIGQAAPPLQYLYGLISNKHPFFGYDLDSYRAKNTYKSMYDNPLLSMVVGGVEREPTGKKESGEIVYNYTLKDPKQYFKVMSLLSPGAMALAGAAVNVAPGGDIGRGVVQALAPLVSPRMIGLLGSNIQEGEQYSSAFLNAISPVKLREVDLTAAKRRKMREDLVKVASDLQQETRRIRAFRKFGQDITKDDFDMLDEADPQE